MPLLTAEQIEELRQIIQDGATALSVATLGDEVTDEELQRLVDEGYVDPEVLDDLVLNAFTYGQLMNRLPAARQMTFAQFSGYLRQNPVSLSGPEREAYKVASTRAGTFCRGLGNRFSDELGRVVVNADAELARELREGIAGEVAESIVLREGRNTLVRRLREMSGQMTRDWTRIAATESHLAHQEGFFEDTVNRQGAGTLLAKVPDAAACDACRAAYLGEDGKPAVHPASWWAAQGSNNVGRKKAEWRPVLGAMHPWCFPPGQLVTTARGRVPIEAVQVGDLVVTAAGRWRPVRQVFRHYFEGEVVDLEVGAERLTMTGSHLVGMASGDWQEAESVREGAELIIIADPVDLPSQPDQVSRLAAVLLCLDRAGVPVTAIDLDGHLRSFPAQVDQVATDDDVVAKGEPPPPQGATKVLLQSGVGSAGPGVQTYSDLLICAGGSAPRLVRRAGQALALIGADDLEADLLSFASRARSSPSILDALDDGAAAHPELAGYFQYGSVLLEVEVQDQIGVEFAHEPILPAHSAIVNKTGRRRYRGYVYNLGVDEDQSYLVQGLAVHNCQCQLVEVPAGFEFDDEGSLVPQEARVAESANLGEGEEPVEKAESLNKRLVAKVGGVRVYEVDGEVVREEGHRAFTNYAHHWSPELGGLVPEGEGWLDKEQRGGERHYLMDGMLRERAEMKAGRSYDQALKAADRVMRSERDSSVRAKEAAKLAPENWLDQIELGVLGRVNGLKVVLADGELIRDKYPNWTEGGHDLVYKWGRPRTIYIDDDLKPHERPKVIRHEATERELMEDGMSYHAAHRRALIAEDQEGGLVLEKGDFDHPLHFQTHYGDLPVSVENRAGSYRRWYDKAAGREGKTLMRWHYGRIPRTRGVDGDAVDVFLKPGAEPGPNVYVITTMKPPEFKKVDEQKVMLGARSRKEAKAAYLAHYDDPRFYGHMTSMSFARFCREIKGTLRRPKLIKHQLSFWEKGADFPGYSGAGGSIVGSVGTMGHQSPGRTAGANVLNTDPVTEWPPLMARPERKKRRVTPRPAAGGVPSTATTLQHAAERFDLVGTSRSDGGWANPPNNDQVQAERGEVEKDIGRAAVSGHRYREELAERQRLRAQDRRTPVLDERYQDYHRGSKLREDDDDEADHQG